MAARSWMSKLAPRFGKRKASCKTRRPQRQWRLETLEERLAPASRFTEIELLTSNSGPNVITTGPDERIWFTQYGVAVSGQGQIGRIDPLNTAIRDEFLVPLARARTIIQGPPEPGYPNGTLWFTQGVGDASQPAPKIGVMSPSGLLLHEYPLPSGADPGLAAAPDGSGVWFSEYWNNKVRKMDTNGNIVATYTTPFPWAPYGANNIAVAPDGTVWLTSAVQVGTTGILGRITPQGVVSSFSYGGRGLFRGLAIDPHGNVWTGELNRGKIAKISPSGAMLAEYDIGPGAGPYHIVLGPNNDLYFTDYGLNNIGRITMQGAISTFQVPTPASGVAILTLGPDNAIWFNEGAANKIGRFRLANSAPVAEIAFRNSAGIEVGSVNEGNTVYLDRTGTIDPEDEDNHLLRYTWTFPDGQTLTTSDPTTQWLATDNGDFTFTLTVTDPFGASATIQREITVHNVAPTVALATSPARPNFDATFGANGRVVTNVPGTIATPAEAFTNNAPVVLADGSTLVLVNVYDNDGTYASILRYDPDGSLDGSYGTEGRVSTFGPGSWGLYLTAQADGTAYLAGYSDGQSVVARYLPDGTPDPAFGATTGSGRTGVALIDVDLTGPYISRAAIAVDDQDRVLLGGGLWDPNQQSWVTLVRLNADGTRDTSFGGGEIITDFGNGDESSIAHAIAIQANHRIVVAGAGGALARYLQNGDLDPTFGYDGIVPASGDITRGPADWAAPVNLHLRSTGEIVLVGEASASAWGFAVVQYSAEGDLDTSFGTEGVATQFYDPTVGYLQGLVSALEADGHVTVVYAGRMVRFTPEGQLDQGFGLAGQLESSEFGFGWLDISAVPGGMLLVTGTTFDWPASVGLSRFIPGPGVNLGVSQVLSLDIAAIDPGSVDQINGFTCDIFWGDDQHSQFVTDPQEVIDPARWIAKHGYAAAGTYTITIYATDKDGSQSQVFSIPSVTVSGNPPEMSIAGAAVGVRGESLAFTLSTSGLPGADPAQEYAFNIDWDNDGVTDETVIGPDGTEVVRPLSTPTTAGPTTVDVRVSPTHQYADGWAVNVLPYEMRGDDLFIGGTSAGDNIVIDFGPTANDVSVTLNGHNFGTFAVTGSVFVFGGNGNDTVTINGTLAADVFEVHPDYVTLNGRAFAGASVENWLIDGGSGIDHLYGLPDEENNWAITGNDSGLVNGAIAFSSIQRLHGRGSDTFQFQPGGSISGSIDSAYENADLDFSALSAPISVNLESRGVTASAVTLLAHFEGIAHISGSASTVDTLIGSDAGDTWTFYAWTMGGWNNSMGFSGFENLMGSVGDDVFVFDNWAISFEDWGVSAQFDGTIDGGGGNNRLEFLGYAFPVSVDLEQERMSYQSGSLTQTAVGQFSNIGEVTGYLGLLTGPDAGTDWVFDGEPGFIAAGTRFTGVQSWLAGAGPDHFVVTGAPLAGLILDGRDGSDTYVVNFGNLNGNVRIADSGTSGADDLTVIGTLNDDTLNKTAGFIQWKLASESLYRERLDFSGIESGTLYAADGNDTLLDPDTTNWTLLGGLGDDYISVTGAVGDVSVDAGPGNNTIVITMGELAGPITVNGSEGSTNLIIYAPAGENELTLNSNELFSGSEVIHFNLGPTAAGITIDGSAGDNSLVLQGPPPAPLTPIDIQVESIDPATIHGLVYVDFNNDGEVNFGELALAGVTITLTGFDDLGNPVNLLTQTDSNGIYSFTNLRPSNAAGYTITQMQPAGFMDGVDTLGMVNDVPIGSAFVNDTFTGIVVASGSVAENYNFGERPANGGSVGAGQTATIGFWQNKHGQNLIKALNGGATATQLGSWLAATFPNMYGMLDGMTNTQVAAHYKTLFGRNGHSSPGGPSKMDAQIMATALSVYVTNQSLAGNTAAAYGFQVTTHGVGAATFNVGSNGAAFGVANGTFVSVMDLLLAVNARSSSGLLFDQNGDGVISPEEAGLRAMANNVFSLINESGGI